MIIEYCEHGSLLSYLEKNGRQVDHKQRLGFAADASKGLHYLASRGSCVKIATVSPHTVPGFVHRDIAARNILLSSSLTCKVGDFGKCDTFWLMLTRVVQE